jgi:hypothetical protein
MQDGCELWDQVEGGAYCPVPEIRGILLRSKWAAGKAVRAGLALERAYLNRYVTEEQRSRRPVFIATLGPGPVGCFSAWLARPV